MQNSVLPIILLLSSHPLQLLVCWQKTENSPKEKILLFKCWNLCMSCRHSKLCINQWVHVRVGAHSRVLYSYNRLSLINCPLIPFKGCNSNFFVIWNFLNFYPTIGTCVQRVYLPLELLGVKLTYLTQAKKLHVFGQ